MSNSVKNLVTISLMIFITTIVVILGASVFFNQNKPGANQSLSQQTGSPSPNSGGITSAEVARHNTASDCWMVVSGGVYNVTGFIGLHSGGANQIIPFCGKDATTAFNTKGGGGLHQQQDLGILKNYFIGNLTGANNLPAPAVSGSPNREDD